MSAAFAVIGANYGDEGKGLMVDYLASRQPESVVVRYNGGAQAGHTVLTPEGLRHVFSHIGAGAFAGCPTYLSQFFIVNPMLFLRELETFSALASAPPIWLDRNAFVTTPFDVLINQLSETARGACRHGSCGVGINETVTRCLRSPTLATRVRDLQDSGKLRRKLYELARTWLPERLAEMRLDGRAQPCLLFQRRLEAIIDRYCLDVEAMLSSVTILSSCPRRRAVIFEGAQGLMLDENRVDQFPHVTRSRTGLANVLYLCAKMGIDRLSVHYVTRTYLTRHGAGPLPGQWERRFPDETNLPNDFQGSLRFAPLSLSDLEHSLACDLASARSHPVTVRPAIAITCADQLAPAARNDLSLPVSHISFGPARGSVLALGAAIPVMPAPAREAAAAPDPASGKGKRQPVCPLV